MVAASQSACLPPGMPSIMAVPEYPIEFIFSPGRVTVHHEGLDAAVAEHLATTGASTPRIRIRPSRASRSVGGKGARWSSKRSRHQGELRRLPSGTRGPVPAHGPKLRIAERIHLDPKDANKLFDEITLEDPDALAEPYKQTNYLQARARTSSFSSSCVRKTTEIRSTRAREYDFQARSADGRSIGF